MKLNYNGDVYEGEGYGNVRHGYGVMRFSNGNRYEGQFVDDYMQGKGKYFFADGGYYEGDFYQSFFEGHGERHGSNGAYYIGEFKRDLYDGHGKIVWPCGDWHEGEFANGKMHGRGKASYDGYLYVGEWSDGRFCGKGVITCPDGTTFDGVWDDGYGASVVATFAGGAVKQGRVIYRKFIPIGVVTHKTVTYSNGTYVGDIVDGKRHGKGKYTFDNGAVYEGDWENGLRDGTGVLTTSTYTYSGDFYRDRRSGDGVITYKDGTKISGNWLDDENATHVTEEDKRGNKISGTIVDGNFIPETTTGYIMKWYSNGYYHGIMKNGTRFGEGVYLWKNGNSFAGQWRRERFGKGIFIYADGTVIKGIWVGSQFAYDATRISKNGTIQKGLYIQDKFIPDTTPGFETVNLSGGAGKYIGVRTNGRLTGYACVKYSNGDIAIGEFDDGYLVGKGATSFAEDFHVGMFVKGTPQGKGVSYLGNGDAYEGDWRGYDDADNVSFYNVGKTTHGTIRGGFYCGK